MGSYSVTCHPAEVTFPPWCSNDARSSAFLSRVLLPMRMGGLRSAPPQKNFRISYPKNRRFRQGRIKTKLRLMLQQWCRVDSAKGRARLCRPPTFCMLFCMLPVFFDTDQSHSTPRCAEIQPISQQSAAASRNVSVSVHTLLLCRAVDAVLGLCR